MSARRPNFIVAAVDDDRGVLRSLAALLESADYTVRLFVSATAMLESGSLDDIDCLISDIGMPVMDGFEFLRRVRVRRPALPIILISGRVDLIARTPDDTVNAYPVFKKPFESEALLVAVGSACTNGIS